MLNSTRHIPFLHISGAYGVDFSYGAENIKEGVQKVAKGLLSQGVTSFCPTVITSSKKDYHKVRYKSLVSVMFFELFVYNLT